MNQLSAFQRDILYIVADKDEPHGLLIKDDLTEYYHEEINHGRLYPNLDELAERGLIDKGTKDDRTNAYALTEEAREVIAERREWEDELLDGTLETERKRKRERKPGQPA